MSMASRCWLIRLLLGGYSPTVRKAIGQRQMNCHSVRWKRAACRLGVRQSAGICGTSGALSPTLTTANKNAAWWARVVPRCRAGRSAIGWRPGVEHGRSQRRLHDVFPADLTGWVVKDWRRSSSGARCRSRSPYTGDDQFCRQRGAVHT